MLGLLVDESSVMQLVQILVSMDALHLEYRRPLQQSSHLSASALDRMETFQVLIWNHLQQVILWNLLLKTWITIQIQFNRLTLKLFGIVYELYQVMVEILQLNTLAVIT